MFRFIHYGFGHSIFTKKVVYLRKSKQFEQFAAIPFGETFYVSCEIKSKTESSVVADVIAHDLEGQIYNRMIGAKGTILPTKLKANRE